MDWGAMFFQGWEGIVRTLLVGTLAYVVLVACLRIAGKRSLAKLNAFDFVVTVALGSILASILLQESIALAEGATAIGLLLLLQFIVTYGSVHSATFARLIRSEPSLLARDGRFCSATMTQQRLTEDEIMGVVRSAGARDIAEVRFVILEADGTISVSLQP